jgi:purine-binding chemotaxis protein CheW
MKPKKAHRIIDWADVHRRLAEANEALHREFEPLPERRDTILRARARMLAQERTVALEPEETLEVVEFMLAHERYALESGYIREVVPLKELTPLPCVPPFVLGITNVRGQIVSVIDIKRFFGLPDHGITDLNKVIILSDGAIEFGMLADQILGVINLAKYELQASLPTLTGIRADYLKGVTAARLVVLDAHKLIHDKALVVNDEVAP